MERFVSDRVGNRVVCQLCGAPLVINPLCSGDFYPTEFGVTLMSFCKNGHCGLMRPDVVRSKKLYFGKNKKKLKAREIAHAFHLGYVETENIALSIESTDENHWMNGFIKKVSKMQNISFKRLEKAYAVI